MTIVLSVMIFFSFADESDTYLVGSVLEVYLLLTIVMCSLVINELKRNVFLEFLNVFFVIFYVLRIPVLFSEAVSSDVLSRGVSIDEIPWYIFILTVQYLYFVIAILLVNPKTSGNIWMGRLSKKEFKSLMIFCYFVVLLNLLNTYSSFSIYGGGTTNFVSAIIGAIFTERNVVMVLVVMLLVSGKQLLSQYRYSLVVIGLLILFQSVYGGSKSITLELILVLYLGTLVVYGPLKLKIEKWILMFFVGTLGIVMYFVGIVSRGLHVQHIDHSLYNIVLNFAERFNPNIDYFMNAFSYRIGYIDFFIQKISNPLYEPYVNVIYYSQSIIDRLTPGFDLFGVPYVSGAIYSAYFGESKIANSEFLTSFGEAHILLGFFSIFLYISIFTFIKFSILKFKSSSSFNTVLFSLFFMFNYYLWFRGGGLDMQVLFFIYKGIFVIFVMTLVKYANYKIRLN